MNPSALFVRRPVMTTLVMLAILIAGVLGFQQLPVSDLPSIDAPTLQVTATLPGANPGRWRRPSPRRSSASSPPSPGSRR